MTAGIRVADLTIDSYRLFDKPDGVSLSDNLEVWRFLKLLWKDKFPDSKIGGSDPLVLDLDGDGIELTALSSVAPSFDVDGDHFAELTGWVRPDDGMLAIDNDCQLAMAA